jgi:hypothetical protein
MEMLDTPREQAQAPVSFESVTSPAYPPVKYDYRGFTISIRPLKDHEDLWDFEYRLTQDGTQVSALRESVRSRTLSGHATPEIACEAGFELAKIEIDHRLAL